MGVLLSFAGNVKDLLGQSLPEASKRESVTEYSVVRKSPPPRKSLMLGGA
jgi:hypothetical protein